MIITDNGFQKVGTEDQPIKYREAINNNADNAVGKIEGKGLSTNDFTDELKSKYDNYETEKEPKIVTKGTAFNKNFGITANTVAEGDKVVPPARTINNKALTSDITLSASDVGTYSKSELNDKIVYTLGYSKVGSVHRLTGTVPTSGFYSARFKANGNFTSGDSITINGINQRFATTNFEPLETNFFKALVLVPIEVDVANKRITFKSGGGGINRTLPPQIRNFTLEAGNAKVTLNWNLPLNTTDYAGLLIVRKAGSSPTGVNDGTKINLSNTATSYIDTGLTNDVTYYYRAFPYNSKKQYQTLLLSAVVSGTPVAYVIYGMKIAKNNSDPATRVTYTDEAIGMSPCYMNYSSGSFNYGSWKDFIEELATPVMLNYNGTEAYELDRNDQTKKADGTASDVSNINFAGNAMVRLKKIYMKIYDDDNYHYFKFSFGKIDGTYHAYAFTNQNVIEQDNAYMPMFKGSLDSVGRLRSIAGRTPIASKTGQQEIDAVNKNGNGYYTQYWSIWNLKAFILCLISKTTNTQKTFGEGSTSGNSAPLTTGTLKTKGAFFGYSSTTKQVKCLYSEVMWGDICDRLMGYIIDSNGNIKIKNYPSYNPTGNGYTTIKTISENSGGYLKHTDITSNGCIGTKLDGSSSTYFCDCQYLYKPSSNPYYALVGGYWCDGSVCGAFYLHCNRSFSRSDSAFGASPFFLAP